MRMKTPWVRPVFILLAVFAVVMLLMNLDQVFPDVEWAVMNATIVPILPWLIGLGIAVYTLFYVTNRRN